MPYDSFSDARAYILNRAGEDGTDTTTTLYSLAGDFLTSRWRDVVLRFPWIGLTRTPPGVFVTSDDITTLTVTVVTAGVAVAGTLSAAPAGSISVLNYKMRPTGKDWIARITAHVAGETGITLDAAPETLAAASAITLFQDEYILAATLALFIDGLWTQEGNFVALVGEEELKAKYPDPPAAGYPPDAFARLTMTRIRLSSYPTAVKRIEYPYTYFPADPSGSGIVDLPSQLREVWAELALADLLGEKYDRRENSVLLKAEAKLEQLQVLESRLRMGEGMLSHGTRLPPYGDRKRGGYGS